MRLIIMGINTSKTLIHNIFDEQITMAKKIMNLI